MVMQISHSQVKEGLLAKAFGTGVKPNITGVFFDPVYAMDGRLRNHACKFL